MTAGDQLGQRAKNERLALISAELRRRMRTVCPAMPEDPFFEMIERMAAVQLKYELLDERPPP